MYIYSFIKNVSSSITHQKIGLYVIPKLRKFPHSGNLDFFFQHIQIDMNANNMKTQIFVSLKGQIRSFFILKSTFSQIFWVCNLILSNFGMNANIIKLQLFHKMKFDLFISLTYVLIQKSYPFHGQNCKGYDFFEKRTSFLFKLVFFTPWNSAH